MMNRFKLSFQLFISNLSLNLLIILQLCSVIVFGNMVIALQNSAIEPYKLTAGFASNSSLIYMPSDKSVYLNDNSAINRYGDLIRISRCMIYDIGLYDDSRVLVAGYGDCISDVMKKQLTEGIWYTDAEQHDGIINCVISGSKSKYPIGSTIIARGYAGTTIIDGYHYDDMRELSFRVCGYFNDNPSIIQLSVSSSELNANNLFKKYKTTGIGFFDSIYNSGQRKRETTSKDLIILCAGNIPDIVNLGSANAVIVLPSQLSDSHKENLIKDLNSEAEIAYMDDVRERSLRLANDKIASYLPMLICFAAMGILGIICISVMTMYRNKKSFRIYINCGMRKKDGVEIIIGYLILLLSLTITIFAMIWIFLLKMQILPWSSMLIGMNNYLFSAGCIVCIAALMLVLEISMMNSYYNSEENSLC